MFSIYTNKVQCNSNDLTLIKYADDMALVACQQHTDSASHRQYINGLVSWFDSSFMDLNVTKTKELCLGGNWRAGNTGSTHTYESISMKGQWSKSLTSSIWEHSLTIDSPSRRTPTTSIRRRDSDLLFSGNEGASTPASPPCPKSTHQWLRVSSHITSPPGMDISLSNRRIKKHRSPIRPAK